MNAFENLLQWNFRSSMIDYSASERFVRFKAGEYAMWQEPKAAKLVVFGWLIRTPQCFVPV